MCVVHWPNQKIQQIQTGSLDIEFVLHKIKVPQCHMWSCPFSCCKSSVFPLSQDDLAFYQSQSKVRWNFLRLGQQQYLWIHLCDSSWLRKLNMNSHRLASNWRRKMSHLWTSRYTYLDWMLHLSLIRSRMKVILALDGISVLVHCIWIWVYFPVRQAFDLIRALCCRLCIMGVTTDSAMKVYCDSESTCPQSWTNWKEKKRTNTMLWSIVINVMR